MLLWSVLRDTNTIFSVGSTPSGTPMVTASPESTLRARMVSTSREPQRSTLKLGLRYAKSLKGKKVSSRG